MTVAAKGLTVLLATRNRAQSLERVLQGLARQRIDPGLRWELVVVNNSSTDATEEVLRAWHSQLPLIVLQQPTPGKYRAVNQGLDIAGGELIVFTDDDIIPASDWLQTLADAAVRWPDDDIFGGRVIPEFPNGTPAWMMEEPWVSAVFSRFDLGPEEGRCERTPFGPNMAIRRRALANTRFREDIGPRGNKYPIGGETELLQRLQRSGMRCVYIPGAWVKHSVSLEQTTSNYIWQRGHNFGQGLLKMSLVARSAPRLWGVPRYLWRELTFARIIQLVCLLRRDPLEQRRARWQTQVVKGMIHQSRLRNESELSHAPSHEPKTRG